MRVLLASDRTEAIEAVDYYCYSAARHAASLVPALGGVDAIVFTGGVGENAGAVRARILATSSGSACRRRISMSFPPTRNWTIARREGALV